MTALPFRSIALVFDQDAFAKFNQGPDRAKSIRMTADVLSANSQRSTTYDEDFLRKVMGHSEIPQRRAKSAHKTTGPEEEQRSQVISEAEPGDFDMQSSVLRTATSRNKSTAHSDGHGEKARAAGLKNMESMRGNTYNRPSNKWAHVKGMHLIPGFSHVQLLINSWYR